MRIQRRFLAVAAATVLLCGWTGGCASSTPTGDSSVQGTDGGRAINDDQSDNSRFDPDGFMGGFQGKPEP